MEGAAKKIMDDLKRRNYAPVYVLQGEETYYIDLIANFIETDVLAEHERSFNQVILYGKDAPVSTILTHARRFPMMAERQVVIVREAQDIPDLQKETGAKLLLDYLARPVPSTVLVFCHKHKTLDKRRELGKKVEQLTVSATFRKPYENTLPEFVASYATAKKVMVEDQAVEILCDHVGNDLNRLANEIDKLTLTLAPGQTLTADNVMSQVGISREYNIFELQKALINDDILQLARIVGYLESNTKRNSIIPLIAFLYSFFSKLLIAASTGDRSEKNLITVLKISPFAVRDYSSALRKYGVDKIASNIALLRQTDLKSKGVNAGSESDGQLLRELVFRLL
jgi:DNA polymerase-3 subunit delta